MGRFPRSRTVYFNLNLLEIFEETGRVSNTSVSFNNLLRILRIHPYKIPRDLTVQASLFSNKIFYISEMQFSLRSSKDLRTVLN